jgi:hypothetical protein
MKPNTRKLRVVEMPTIASVLKAPPVLDAYGTLEFACGGCDAVLLVAEVSQMGGVLIHCTLCGVTNAVDAKFADGA